MYSRTKTISVMGLLLAVLIVLGAMPPLTIGFLPVPLVLQNFGVMLTAFVLPVKPATGTIGSLLALAALGLPVLSGGRGGLAVFAGPTAGYMVGWLLTPVTLWLVDRVGGGRWPRVLAVVVMVVVTNLCGAAWLAISTQLSLFTSLVGTLAYVPGDAVKAVLASVVASQLVRVQRRIRE